MPNIATTSTACHVAYLDPLTGHGALVCPRPDIDMHAPATPSPVGAGDVLALDRASLHEVDFNAMVDRLIGLGWTLYDDMLAMGETIDGRLVLALYGLDPIHDAPSVDQLAESDLDLQSAAGIA